MGAMASQITSLTIVYSIVHSGADQRKRQSSASLAFVRVIHRWPVNSPHKWPVTRGMFPFDDVIMHLKMLSARWRLMCFIRIIPNKPLVQCIHHSPGWVMTIVGCHIIDFATDFHVIPDIWAANEFGFRLRPLTTHDAGICHNRLALDPVLVTLMYEETLSSRIVQSHHDAGMLKPKPKVDNRHHYSSVVTTRDHIQVLSYDSLLLSRWKQKAVIR